MRPTRWAQCRPCSRTYRDYPAAVSTYTLRSANPAKTRCDAVVIGVVQGGKGSKDALAVAPGGEDVAKAYGRTFRPLLASLGVTGKAGEVTKVPTGKQLSSPVLVIVGLGKVAKDGKGGAKDGTKDGTKDAAPAPAA